MQSKKLNIETEFICKIADIIKNHNQLVTWSQDGTQMRLQNIDQITKNILPLYFRHSNFDSFLRQLNMYNFVKVEKSGRNMIFKHALFYRGNQKNFYKIQKRKKFGQIQNFQGRFEKECDQILVQIKNKNQITQQMKQNIIALLQFKFIGYQNFKKIKCELQTVYFQLKDTKNKKVQQLCCQLKKDIIDSIKQLNQQSKKIDEYILNELSKQDQRKIENIEPASQQNTYNPQFQNRLSYNHNNLLGHSFMASDFNSQNNVQRSQQNFLTVRNYPILVEDYRSGKQHEIQNNLYNPFNSQNSFVYMPNYLGVQSHFQAHGHNLSQTHHFEQEQNNFQESQCASISFIRNISHENEQQLQQI